MLRRRNDVLFGERMWIVGSKLVNSLNFKDIRRPPIMMDSFLVEEIRLDIAQWTNNRPLHAYLMKSFGAFRDIDEHSVFFHLLLVEVEKIVKALETARWPLTYRQTQRQEDLIVFKRVAAWLKDCEPLEVRQIEYRSM